MKKSAMEMVTPACAWSASKVAGISLKTTCHVVTVIIVMTELARPKNVRLVSQSALAHLSLSISILTARALPVRLIFTLVLLTP